jgi:hypothetical protein
MANKNPKQGGGAPPGMFAGMMPRAAKPPMPSGFSPTRDAGSPPRDEPEEDMDLDTLTTSAHQEWENIAAAFETIKARFGPEFQPLGPDVYPAEPTPFGPAAHYKTYSIAGIWMNLNMGYLMLHRAHPAMPPFAMVAAGISAQRTAGYAMEIGRIAAGLEENITRLEAVSTMVAAALIESCFCLFVAGIQVCAVLSTLSPVSRCSELVFYCLIPPTAYAVTRDQLTLETLH